MFTQEEIIKLEKFGKKYGAKLGYWFTFQFSQIKNREKYSIYLLCHIWDMIFQGKIPPNDLKKVSLIILKYLREEDVLYYCDSIRYSRTTLKDIICLCHPKPVDKEQEILFKKILDGEIL